MRQTLLMSIALLVFNVSPALADVVFDWAAVGNAGNANDTTGFGGVSYNYRISKHEVTNSQYAEFLNKVATTDSFGGADATLFNASMDISQSGAAGSFTYNVNSGFESNPVNYVSFFDAMRFVNWLENGQDAGGTESGVYSIGTGLSETRAPGATFFLPSENEWYKAAYHAPGATGDYWDYPTQSNSAPTAQAPPGGVNSANMSSAVGDTTDVGAYPGSTSFYGTFDQAGNLWEWNEAVISSSRGLRGGSWNINTGISSASFRSVTIASDELSVIGFRVASIPEPSSVLYLGLVLLGVGTWKKLTS